MKRALLYFLGVVLIVAGLFLLLQLYNRFKPHQNGALQVSANVASKVYLDGELVGETPFCRGDIALCQGDTGKIGVGEHTIKIVPTDASLSPYTIKTEVLPGVMTAVDRTFLPDGLSSAYTLTLEKNKDGATSLFAQSIPSGALVALDGVSGGVTPFTDEEISPSEHVLEIQKAGFAKKTIRIRTVEGYTLVVNVILGAEGEEEAEEEQKEDAASVSAQVKILNTPTGFLRVRSGPGVGNEEIGTVEPGATFVIIEEKGGWYHIQLDAGKDGWVSEEFVEKVEVSDEN